MNDQTADIIPAVQAHTLAAEALGRQRGAMQTALHAHAGGPCAAP